jgi:hypothetical protein
MACHIRAPLSCFLGAFDIVWTQRAVLWGGEELVSCGVTCYVYAVEEGDSFYSPCGGHRKELGLGESQ